MKTLKLITLLFAALVISCGGKEEKKEEKFSYEKKSDKKETVVKEEKVPASKQINLTEWPVQKVFHVEHGKLSIDN